MGLTPLNIPESIVGGAAAPRWCYCCSLPGTVEEGACSRARHRVAYMLQPEGRGEVPPHWG